MRRTVWLDVSFVFTSLLLILLFFLLVPKAAGQDSATGAIRGIVEDTAEARIVGAQVVVRNEATGIERRTASDGSGMYVAQFLNPGTYSVEVSAPGMEKQRRTGLTVEVGEVVDLPFQLRVAETRETVTVKGEPAAVDTQASGVSAVVDERAIAELPVNGRRFSDLALLTPGVTQDPRGLTSASNGDLSFGGVRGFQTSFLVDGGDNNNAFFSQARGRYRAPYQFSNEVVQEFRVATNGYGAEHGRAAGAVVNVVTKSGGNRLHGTAFYFLRDSALNARPASLTFKPEDRQHQAGFTLGGPMRKNRAFFFAGFDQHIFHVPTLVRFVDGSATVVPQKGQEPLYHGDYEDSDRALVFAAADQLSQMGGNYRSELLGNTGFLKFDIALSQRHTLTARLSTSRYWGTNNVFFDPASPITTFAISENGEERVDTGTATVSLNSAFSYRLTSRLRAQFSRDWQVSTSNSEDVRTRIAGVMDGFGRSSILPRRTRENKIFLAETLQWERRRHSWKFGGDTLLTRIDNYFPSLFGGEYIFENIRVNPFTFAPQPYGMQATPLRAYAHGVPRYYIQNFGPAESHPDTNEYAGFVQDTIRVTQHFSFSLGVRYDLQTFAERGLTQNPLYPQAGRVPRDTNNFGPRGGFAWSFGEERPFVVRGGFGIFYSRIPQIYTSTLAADNGVTNANLILDNADYYDRQLFPSYPNPLVSCGLAAESCAAPTELASRMTRDVAAFAPNYRTPVTQQSSVSIEKEVAHRLIASISALHVHGQHLIRARDANLPEPVNVEYPVYDDAGVNLLGYYNIDSFSTWQFTQSLTCPFPPCINPLNRPIPQLGAINLFETAASSMYNGLTVSLQRRMTRGLYFRLGYTWAHAIDDGQDALVAGKPVSVQNSYVTKSERASSVTDQRQRFVFSWIAEPAIVPEKSEAGWLLNGWKFSGVFTYGSGRPVMARVIGDANQDGNSSNDRLPGLSRSAFTGPNYATADFRLGKKFRIRKAKLEILAETFNLFNRWNKRLSTTDDGFQNTAAQFIPISKRSGINYFPGHYQTNSQFLRATDAYAARQIQIALRLNF